MSTTDPAPSATPPAEAELIRWARHFVETSRRVGSIHADPGRVAALADALGRAARERDAAVSAIREISAFRPDPARGDPYEQMAAQARSTAGLFLAIDLPRMREER
jgi:hypothetical protein